MPMRQGEDRARRRTSLMEKISAARPADLSHLEIWSIQNSKKLYKVLHNTFTICPIHRIGRGDWKYRGKNLSAYSQQVMLMEPGETHIVERILGASSCDVVFIDHKFVISAAEEAGYKGGLHLNEVNLTSPDAYRLLSSIQQAHSRNASALELGSIVANCLSFLFRQCIERPLGLDTSLSTHRGIQRAKDHLWERCTEKITLEELADIARVDRFHFLRAFTRKFGIPPHTYQLQSRVAQARERLKRGASISHLDLGFSDQSHFIRYFKKVTGFTPGQYALMAKPPRASFNFLEKQK
jgi:AraC-like DNA-binding protein